MIRIKTFSEFAQNIRAGFSRRKNPDTNGG